MKSYTIVAWIRNGTTYCLDCALEAGLPPTEEAQDTWDWIPVFAGDEYDFYPTCDNCLEPIEDITLIQEED